MRIPILDVYVDPIRWQDVDRLLETYLSGSLPKQITTINPEFVMAAQTNRAFREVLRRADLAVPDGVGLQWATAYTSNARPIALWFSLVRFALSPRSRVTVIPERIQGVRIVEALLKRANEHHLPVTLLHRRDGRSRDTEIIEAIRYTYPNVPFSCYTVSQQAVAIDDQLRGFLQRSAPVILFADPGAPFQEFIVADAIRHLPSVRVALGVGGSLDFATGRSRRAPNVVQTAGMEWFWRLITEPRRWNRILTATLRFIRTVHREKVHTKSISSL